MQGVFGRSTIVAAVASLALVAATHAAGPPGGDYLVTPLVSDVPGLAPTTDPNLVNAWGLARSATSPWWVADNGPDPSTSKSTLYNGAGTPFPLPPNAPLVVSVPGAPTGAVFAGSPGNFPIATATSTTLGPAAFIFATEAGEIRAWRGGSTALAAPATGDPGAIYKGLAIAGPSGSPLLYATDFANARVDVFDGTWANVTPSGAFVDPNLPSGYAPFGIQTIGSRIFVTYAKQGPGGEDEVDGQSLGFVDAYDFAGNLLARVAQRGQLNAPWGLALAPASFGRYAGDLLVGNFGDGQINAYAERDGTFTHAGTLRDNGGQKLVIDGLWALEFGNAPNNGDAGTLFFTAGPDDESHGLFGTITTP